MAAPPVEMKRKTFPYSTRPEHSMNTQTTHTLDNWERSEKILGKHNSSHIIEAETFICKSTNPNDKNIVAYQATLKENGDICKVYPLNMFRLEIDRQTVISNRANGKDDDRTEIGLLEKRVFYDYKSISHQRKKNYFFIELHCLPGIEFELQRYDDELALVHRIGGEDGLVRSIHIETIPRCSMGIPKVDYVDLICWMTGTKKYSTERIRYNDNQDKEDENEEDDSEDVSDVSSK